MIKIITYILEYKILKKHPVFIGRNWNRINLSAIIVCVKCKLAHLMNENSYLMIRILHNTLNMKIPHLELQHPWQVPVGILKYLCVPILSYSPIILFSPTPIHCLYLSPVHSQVFHFVIQKKKYLWIPYLWEWWLCIEINSWLDAKRLFRSPVDALQAQQLERFCEYGRNKKKRWGFGIWLMYFWNWICPLPRPKLVVTRFIHQIIVIKSSSTQIKLKCTLK